MGYLFVMLICGGFVCGFVGIRWVADFLFVAFVLFVWFVFVCVDCFVIWVGFS